MKETTTDDGTMITTRHALRRETRLMALVGAFALFADGPASRRGRRKRAETPAPPPPPPAVRAGRNDPCPCGSGKKFKRCCRATS